MDTISRSKYDRLKEKTHRWYERSQELKSRVTELEEKNKEYQEKLRGMNNTELVEENKELKSVLKTLKKSYRDLEEKDFKQNFDLQKEMMLKEGKVRQLEESLDMMKKRYQELYEEYRAHRRWELETSRKS